MQSQHDLVIGVITYTVFLFSTVAHEAAHAWSARKFGDDTAAAEGLISIDPLPHIKREPIGMVLLPLLGVLMGGGILGWGSAPYDPVWAARYPRKKALMALAGPMTNLLIALVAALLIFLGISIGFLTQPDSIRFSQLVVGKDAFAGPDILLSLLVSMNLVLFFFNLIPVPPLDGSSVITLILPKRAAQKYEDLRHEPVVRQLGIFFVYACGSSIAYPIVRYVLSSVF